MKLLSVLFACLGLLLLRAGSVAADDKQPVEPTKEQIDSLKKTFETLGGSYQAKTDTATKQTRHTFALPRETTDGDLKKLPQVPFPFELHLFQAKVTDEGLKELKELKNLTGLHLAGG